MDSKEIKRQNEEKKLYLQGYRNALKEVERLRYELQRTYYDFGLSSPGYDGMPHGSGGSGDLANRMVRLENDKRRLSKAEYKCHQKMKEITNRINMLQEQNERDVLYYRYIEGMTWEKIGEVTGYSDRQVWRIHGRGLFHFHIW